MMPMNEEYVIHWMMA